MLAAHHNPFVDPDYVRAFGGTVIGTSGFPIPLIQREIPGTPFHDGRLPWPYVCVDVSLIGRLQQAFPELVSVVGVLLPAGGAEPAALGDLHRFKEHFVFNPSLPQKPLSRKSASNLATGSQRWSFRQSTETEDWQEFGRLYRLLVERRQLAGSSFDFPDAHFGCLSALPYVKLFGVHDGSQWGAMTCMAQFSRQLHLIHIVVSTEGLQSNASYVMMQSLLDAAVEGGLTVFMGSVPAGDAGGMLKFKSRWSNCTAPSWLVKKIIRPDVYEQLAEPGNSFFPAYRRNW